MQNFWDKDQDKAPIKTRIFSLYHKLLQYHPSNLLIYKIILLIEVYQFFWYIISPLQKENDTTFWFFEAIKYFQIDNALELNDKGAVLTTLLYLQFIWQTLHFSLLVYTGFKLTDSKVQMSKNKARTIQLINISNSLMNSVLSLPMFHICIAFLICGHNQNMSRDFICYKGIYFLHFSIALILLLIHILNACLTHFFYFDPNPFSTHPYAIPFTHNHFIKLILKILLPIYSLLIISETFDKAGLFFFAFFWAFKIIMTLRSSPYYMRSVGAFIIGIDLLMLWMTFSLIITLTTGFGDSPTAMLIFFIICAPGMIYSLIQVMEWRENKIKNRFIKDFEKDTEVEFYICAIINLIENRKKLEQLMDLEGLLQYHTKFCLDLNCNCPSLLELTKDNKANEKEWYLWVHHLLTQGIEKFPKSPRLHYFSAVIYREKLDDKFQSLYAIYSLLRSKPTLGQEFAAFRYIKFIENQIIVQSQVNSEENGIQFDKAVEFYKEFAKLENWVKETTCFYIDFWTELLEKNSNADRITTLGIQIMTFQKKLAPKYEQLIKLKINSLPLLQLYNNFLREVINDQNEAGEIKEKLKNFSTSAISRQQLLETQNFSDEDLQKPLIVVSADPSSFGLITDISSEAAKIFGYEKNELLSKNISILTPSQFGSAWVRFFNLYSGSDKVDQKNLEHFVYPLNKKGYLKPCYILPYIIPHLQEGLQLVFFVKELENNELFLKRANSDNRFGITHFIAYDFTNQMIIGVTESCYESFGISAEIIKNSNGEFFVGDIFPEFENIVLDNPFIEDFITILDTSTFDQRYFIPEKSETSINIIPERQGNSLKYRRARVCITVLEDPIHMQRNFKFLKFIEIANNEEENEEVQVSHLSAKEEYQNKDQNEEVTKESTEQESVHSDFEDRESIHSIETLHQDIKNTRDLKALLSKKKTPALLKAITVSVLFVCLILVAIISFRLVFTHKYLDKTFEGFQNIGLTYERFNSMVELTFTIRQIEKMAYPDYDTTFLSFLKTKMAERITYLSETQHKLMETLSYLSDKGLISIDQQEFLIETKFLDEIVTEKMLYIDGFFKYIASATQIRNASISSFYTKANPVDPTLDNIYNVRRNGYGPLREGAEQAIKSFNDYYADRLDYFYKFKTYEVIMIELLAIVFCVAIFHVMSLLENNNSKIISLFGYLPKKEINQLLDQCENFLINNYEESAIPEHIKSLKSFNTKIMGSQNLSIMKQRNISFKDTKIKGEVQEEWDNSALMNLSENIQITPIAQFQVTQRETERPLNRYETTGHDYLATGPVTSRLPEMSYSNNVTINSYRPDTRRPLNQVSDFSFKRSAPNSPDMTLNQVFKYEEEQNLVEEIDEEKATRLYRSRTVARESLLIKIIITFLLGSLILNLEYFLFYRWFISKSKIIYNHLNHNLGRSAYVKYMNAFAFEEIWEVDPQNVYQYPGQTDMINQRQKYEILTQESNTLLSDPKHLEFPSIFDNYLKVLNDINNGNFCPYATTKPSGRAICESSNNGLYTKGLSLSITSDIIKTNAALQNFQTAISQIDTSNATQASIDIATQVRLALTGELYLTTSYIITQITPIMEQLKIYFVSACSDFIDMAKSIKSAIYGGFLLIYFLGALFWIPIVHKLNRHTMKLRRMLNIIPLQIIVGNENLKELFLSQRTYKILS